VRVVEPDTYLVELFDEQPDEVVATIVRIAGEKSRPPMTPLGVLAALRGAGLARFPERIAPRL
jgi:hypothetical protein